MKFKLSVIAFALALTGQLIEDWQIAGLTRKGDPRKMKTKTQASLGLKGRENKSKTSVYKPGCPLLTQHVPTRLHISWPAPGDTRKQKEYAKRHNHNTDKS